MSFFSSLTGGKQRGDIYKGQQEAATILQDGMKGATTNLYRQYGQADSALGRGQRQTTAAYNTGRADINSGADQALGYYQGANALMQPYQAQGTRANTMYGNALGINGADARAQTQGVYMSDPIMEQLMAGADKSTFQRYNAGGMGDSGASRAAVLQGRYNNYGGWLDRLDNQGNRGLQAAQQMGQNNSQMANVATNRGNALANMAQWQGNSAANYANQYAGNRVNLGNSLANLVWDKSQKVADNAVGARSAIAGTRGMGWQNALEIGKMAVSAATGMPMPSSGGSGGGGWNTNPATFANFSSQVTPGEKLPWLMGA